MKTLLRGVRLLADLKKRIEDEAFESDERSDTSPLKTSISDQGSNDDHEALLGNTFFTNTGELDDVPYIQITTHTETKVDEPTDFDAYETLKGMLPEGSQEVEQTDHGNGAFGLGCNWRTTVISALALLIAYSTLFGSPTPLQFPVQLVLSRLLVLFQDCMWKYRRGKLGGQSLVSHSSCHVLTPRPERFSCTGRCPCYALKPYISSH